MLLQSILSTDVTVSHVKQPGKIGCNLVPAILPGPITCLISEDTMQQCTQVQHYTPEA